MASTHHHPPKAKVHIFADPDDLIRDLATFILKAQTQAIESETKKVKDKFTIAISGGSLPKQLKGLIGAENNQGDTKAHWDKW